MPTYAVVVGAPMRSSTESVSTPTSANSHDERYRSVLDGMITTICLPLFSGRFANWSAAQTAAARRQ